MSDAEKIDMERDIHVATLMRLQVVHNALERVSGSIGNAVLDLPAVARRLTALGETGMAGDITEMRDTLNAVRPLISAALDIARGARSEVPPELRGSLIPDPRAVARYLEIPAGR